jgi:hypothetical protein
MGYLRGFEVAEYCAPVREIEKMHKTQEKEWHSHHTSLLPLNGQRSHPHHVDQP